MPEGLLGSDSKDWSRLLPPRPVPASAIDMNKVLEHFIVLNPLSTISAPESKLQTMRKGGYHMLDVQPMSH